MSNYCGHWQLFVDSFAIINIDWYNSIIGDGDIKVVIVGVFDVMYWSNHVTNTDNDLALWALNGYFNLFLITKISFPFVYKASSLCFLGSRKMANIFEGIKDYHRRSQSVSMDLEALHHLKEKHQWESWWLPRWVPLLIQKASRSGA